MCNTGTIRLAIIGDVHSHWYEDDAEALESLAVDAAVFIGRVLALQTFPSLYNQHQLSTQKWWLAKAGQQAIPVACTN